MISSADEREQKAKKSREDVVVEVKKQSSSG
jgi:hypothetical protein